MHATLPKRKISTAKAEEHPLMKLPHPARRAFVKLIHIVPLFVSKRNESEIDQIVSENTLTEEERISFRKHFPDGLFGRIVL